MPPLSPWLRKQHLTPHVVENTEGKAGFAPGDALKRPPLAWLKQQVEIAATLQKRLEANGDKAVGGEFAIHGLPRRAHL